MSKNTERWDGFRQDPVSECQTCVEAAFPAPPAEPGVKGAERRSLRFRLREMVLPEGPGYFNSVKNAALGLPAPALVRNAPDVGSLGGTRSSALFF